MNFKIPRILFFLSVLLFLLSCGFYIEAQVETGAIDAIPENGNNKIAVGEVLPISIELFNFESGKVVDVTISYKVLNSKNEEVYFESETSAVETTASFLKSIRIPFTMEPGHYKMVISLDYKGQEQSAVSEFSFEVEEKFGGLFKNELTSYIILIFIVIFAAFFSTCLLKSCKKIYRPVSHDYSDKPKDQIIYYEILSDILSQMRLKIGSAALEIAKNIPNLEIDDANGKIISIKDEPAKIVALLVTRYEKISGDRIDFSIRRKQKNKYN